MVGTGYPPAQYTASEWNAKFTVSFQNPKPVFSADILKCRPTSENVDLEQYILGKLVEYWCKYFILKNANYFILVAGGACRLMQFFLELTFLCCKWSTLNCLVKRLSTNKMDSPYHEANG